MNSKEGEEIIKTNETMAMTPAALVAMTHFSKRQTKRIASQRAWNKVALTLFNGCGPHHAGYRFGKPSKRTASNYLCVIHVHLSTQPELLASVLKRVFHFVPLYLLACFMRFSPPSVLSFSHWNGPPKQSRVCKMHCGTGIHQQISQQCTIWILYREGDENEWERMRMMSHSKVLNAMRSVA